MKASKKNRTVKASRKKKVINPDPVVLISDSTQRFITRMGRRKVLWGRILTLATASSMLRRFCTLLTSILESRASLLESRGTFGQIQIHRQKQIQIQIHLQSLCTFVICKLESTLGRVGDGGKGVALIGNLCNALALVISKPGFFGEGGFTILTFGSILGFLEEALLARAFLFSGEVGGGELDCF